MKRMRLFALALALMLAVGVFPVADPAAKADAAPEYWIGVDVQNQRTTIYRVSDNSVVHRWLCTTGASSTPTPQGVFYLPEARGAERQEWFAFTGTYVKYAVRYTARLYFHSVLFKKKNDNAMKVSTLHNLGHKGSAGCVRLEVQHAKWVCDNCPTGTMVVIHNGVDDPRITSILGGPAGIETTPSLPAPPIVVGLTLDPAGPITLNRGESLQLNCAIEPANATTSLRWKSSKKKYVTVDDNGLVTAVGNGVATITVTASNGVKAQVKVTSVDNSAARSVAINANKIVYVNVGETLQLGATVEPAAAAAGLTWKSSRPRYATVDANGLVTGLAKGSAKITVTTSNRKKSSVTVKVLDPNAPAAVAISQPGPITLHAGETLQLSAALTPSTAKSTFTWTSSRARVATVDASGLVTAVAKGRAKITVKTANKKKATIVINVVQ